MTNHFRRYYSSVIEGSLLEKRLLFITGSPGTGKTSLLLKTIEVLRARGWSIGGMVSREVRSCGTRVGFEILDLNSSGRGWLAHVNQKYGPMVGKYRVNLEDLDNIGAEAVANAVEIAHVVVIDEIGPMELCSKRFKEVVKRVAESGKLVIGTVHWRAKDKLIEEIKGREDAEIYKVTYENRGNLHEMIVEKAAEFLARSAKSGKL
jgi:nucleoside-triphosphatase